MRSIVVSSSARTSALSEVRSDCWTSSWRRRSSVTVMPSVSASSSRVGRRRCRTTNSSTALSHVALPAADRARGPVLAAQLVEDGAVDAGPDVLLERRALVRVVAVDALDQRLEAARHEVLDVAAGRHLAHLLVDDVLDQRCERQDEAVAHGAVAGRLYSRHNASASSEDRRRLVGEGSASFTRWLLDHGGDRFRYRVGAELSASPLWGSDPIDIRRPPHPQFWGGEASNLQRAVLKLTIPPHAPEKLVRSSMGALKGPRSPPINRGRLGPGIGPEGLRKDADGQRCDGGTRERTPDSEPTPDAALGWDDTVSAEVFDFAEARRRLTGQDRIPDELWDDIARAGQLVDDLADRGQQVRFDTHRLSGRVVASLCDYEGRRLRRLPLRDVLGRDTDPAA